MPPSPIRAARERQRTEVMRAIAEVAIRLFGERGFDEVTIETVAREAGVSPATLYRRFGTKENLVCWAPDEQDALAGLLERLHDGAGVVQAATDLVETFPDDAVDAVESTGRLRLELIAAHPQLGAAAHAKAAGFTTEVLAATEGRDQRSRLERETEVACVVAAMDAGTAAWARGDGTLRTCMRTALATLRAC
ncbi:AcrR family transcriptional regulator [Mumia flava]|uniref:AcrR family transcriptional regulator n=1 Tax=Mumia flava TaxID=1348852 RepID=A0A2M9BE17_9ACTN|nr:TetR/AcrR family transcriptional regulator [Mumia flava]PJJ56191.1 AcrR family transcriptional regulator [Mumia flava]